MAGMVVLSLSSCDDIYDDPSSIQPVQTGYKSFNNIDAKSYTNWVYLNLQDSAQTTVDYKNTADIPANWHLAIHRYDIKTNSGAAYKSSYTSLNDVKADMESGALVLPSANEFKTDEDGRITVDMSHMMVDGTIEYADSKLNKEIGQWLDVDTSQMPPTYTLGNNVYFLRMADGTYAAIKFTGFSDPSHSNIKGYISFSYIYPMNIQ